MILLKIFFDTIVSRCFNSYAEKTSFFLEKKQFHSSFDILLRFLRLIVWPQEAKGKKSLANILESLIFELERNTAPQNNSQKICG